MSKKNALTLYQLSDTQDFYEVSLCSSTIASTVLPLSRKTFLRTCIHNLNSPLGRVYSRHAALNFLEINTMIPAKSCLACRENPSPIRRFRL